MSSIQLDQAFYDALHELQAIDFVLVELSLFLDTHPNDAAALQQFNQYASMRKQVAQHFEASYGPLLQYGHSGPQDSWKWSQPPWPWQV